MLNLGGQFYYEEVILGFEKEIYLNRQIDRLREGLKRVGLQVGDRVGGVVGVGVGVKSICRIEEYYSTGRGTI